MGGRQTMKTNFKIISFIEIEFNGIELDLHNNYEFIYGKTEISAHQISLYFRKSNRDWAIHQHIKILVLSFQTTLFSNKLTLIPN